MTGREPRTATSAEAWRHQAITPQAIGAWIRIESATGERPRVLEFERHSRGGKTKA